MDMKLRRLVWIVLALVAVAGCDKARSYHSIWFDVYGETPSYQSDLEELKVE